MYALLAADADVYRHFVFVIRTSLIDICYVGSEIKQIWLKS